jgi:hypothetical protein
MNIKFSNSEIRLICNNKIEMQKAIGNADAALLQRRLLQLSAAKNLGVFLPANSKPMRCRPGFNDERNSFSLPLKNKFELFFDAESNCDEVNEPELDWYTIKTIIIIRIEDIAHD